MKKLVKWKYAFFALMFSQLFLNSCGVKTSISSTVTVDYEKVDDQPAELDGPEFRKKVKSNSLSEYQIKYGEILNVEPESLNTNFYTEIDQWIGTPFLMGGDNKKGIDCSAFVQKVIKKTYGIELPRTSNAQFNSFIVSLYKGDEYLKEGDLVFFNTIPSENIVTHVGIYLRNEKFVGATTSKGVFIDDLYNNYWRPKIIAFGRILQ